VHAASATSTAIPGCHPVSLTTLVSALVSAKGNHVELDVDKLQFARVDELREMNPVCLAQHDSKKLALGRRKASHFWGRQER